MQMQRVLQAISAASLAALMHGCTATIDATKSQVTTQYFGWVRVVTPKPDASGKSPIVSLDTSSVGLRVEDGIGVGYFRDQRFYIPLDCRVVVFVKDRQQLDFVRDKLGTQKEGICAKVKSS